MSKIDPSRAWIPIRSVPLRTDEEELQAHNEAWPNEPVQGSENGSAYQYGALVRTVRGDTDAANGGTDDDGPLEDHELVRELVRRGFSANKVFDTIGGTRSDVLEMVKQIKLDMEDSL